MVAAASLAVGMSGAIKLRHRVRSFSALISALEIMKSEICDRLTPMPELLERLASESDSPADIFFRKCISKMSELGICSFSSIWKSAVHQTPELGLRGMELSVLTDLGSVLGRYDSEEQKSALTYAIRRLEVFLHKAEGEYSTQGKVKAVLGLAAGLMLVIILV